jgi:hypothetical protein
VKRGSWCPKCAGIRRRSKWIALRAIAPDVIDKAATTRKSQLVHLIDDAGIDRPSRLLEEGSLDSLRHASRKSESAHKSQ